MSSLQRILNLASKALDKGSASGGTTGRESARGTQGGTDWRELVRSAADRLTGDGGAGATSRPGSTTPVTGAGAAPGAGAGSHGRTDARPATFTAPVDPRDRAAIARYDYLLQTAEPAQLEQVHREAFAALTPAQREQVEARLRAELPANEQPRSGSADDLALAATRGEARSPGFLRGLLGKMPGAGARGGDADAGAGRRGVGGFAAAGAGAAAGLGLGAAGGLLAAVAGGAIVSSVATPLLEQAAGLGVDFEAFSGGFDELAAGAGEAVSGLGEQAGALGEEAVSGFGEQAGALSEQAGALGEQATGFGEQLSEAGSAFELPSIDLGSLGNFFDR
ncbi:hypothetical protein [Herbiconiux sp. A18JL235]|uniref:Cation-transporting ATPase n=1 Tax=Herbiconiux sp. A18JL235 TaxID=3152363 RepID=A0AB39BJV9_9MICO